MFVPSLKDDGPLVAAALEERGIPFRLVGGAAYFQRAEVRDLLAWLRALADPRRGRRGACAVAAAGRAALGRHRVDDQMSRRRKLDMVAARSRSRSRGPQIRPRRATAIQSFLRLYRAALSAFEDMRADVFVHRLIERIGLRRQQLFAAQRRHARAAVSIAKLGELATA